MKLEEGEEKEEKVRSAIKEKKYEVRKKDNVNFLGVKGAEVPLRKVGDG